METLKTTGLGAPVNWYKLMVSGLGAEDDKSKLEHSICLMI